MRIIKAKSISACPKTAGRVSVIITNYKKEASLKRAILSCMNQSYKDIEIIVVDDGSASKLSLDIVKSLQCNRVRYIYTTKNYGHYACSNYAIDRATGKYITFLGADDTIDKNHIKQLLTALLKHKLVGVCSLYSRYSEAGRLVGAPNRICEASFLFNKRTLIRDIGYFHMVRVGADTEYRLRAVKYYGSSKVGFLQVNTYKALSSKGSLTRSSLVGKDSSCRKSYADQFLKKLKKGGPNLYFNYKSSALKFSLGKNIKVQGFDEKTFHEVPI